VVAPVIIATTIQVKWGRGWVTDLDGKKKPSFHPLRKS
jgi:hypothetical protein